MILDVFVWAFAVSLLTGRFKNVINREYRLLFLFPIPFVLQVLPCCRNILLPISFALLIFFLYKNLHIPGFKYMFVGAMLNGIVMSFNGGKMPVLESLAENMGLNIGSRHILSNWSFWLFLGDWIPVYLPYGRSFIISIGDIFVYVGIFVFFLKKESPRKGGKNDG